MTYEDIPLDVRTWIRGMVFGTTSVEVGHMMFSTRENFRNLIPEHALYLIRHASKSPVRKWIDESEDDKQKLVRVCAARDYTANEVRALVGRLFETATYPGD